MSMPMSRKAKTMGMTLEMTQKIADAILSPNSMHQNDTGIEINRSNVCPRVSVGKMTGPTAVAEKKTTIAISPGISVVGFISRPTTKERKKKNGNRRPKISVGPLV